MHLILVVLMSPSILLQIWPEVFNLIIQESLNPYPSITSIPPLIPTVDPEVMAFNLSSKLTNNLVGTNPRS